MNVENFSKFLGKIWKIVESYFGQKTSSQSEKINPLISMNNINVQNGNFSPNTTIYNYTKSENVETPDEYKDKLIKNYHCYCYTGQDVLKLENYCEQAYVIIRFNDSFTKRHVLRQIIYKKITEGDIHSDDSDSALTLALDSMKYMTDSLLKKLCSYRLLTNVIPTYASTNKLEDTNEFMEFIRQNGCLSKDDVCNLKLHGLMYELDDEVYTMNENFISKDDKYEKIYLTSNTFTAAGLVLTDILIEYYFNLTNVFKEWLPKKKKSMHLDELVVDGDILAQKNLVVYGDTASGGEVSLEDIK